MRWILTFVVTSCLLVVNGGSAPEVRVAGAAARETIKASVPGSTSVTARRGMAAPDVRSSPVVLVASPVPDAPPRPDACAFYEVAVGFAQAKPVVVCARGPPRS